MLIGCLCTCYDFLDVFSGQLPDPGGWAEEGAKDDECSVNRLFMSVKGVMDRI